MRIIQIIQMPQLRGAELFACQLSNHLVEQGHQVIVITLFEGEVSLPFSGEIIHLNRPKANRMWDITGLKKLNKHIVNFSPDIIQANAADTLKYAVSAKIIGRYNIPIVLRNANKTGDFIDSLWKKELNKFYLSKVSYVISVSEECEKDFIKTFDFPAEKITTINIGVENTKIGDVPDDLKEIFKNEIILTHVGSFVPEKNHRGLIRSFSLVHQKFPEAQLILIGVGYLQPEILKEVGDRRLENNIHFLGIRDDVLDILGASSIFVLPSLIEGLPGVLLEAMYCETPVIAYDVGGISEIVTPKTGVLIEKDDEVGFSNAVIEVLKNPDNQIIRNAHTMVMENYMNKEISVQFCQAYQKTISLSS